MTRHICSKCRTPFTAAGPGYCSAWMKEYNWHWRSKNGTLIMHGPDLSDIGPVHGPTKPTVHWSNIIGYSGAHMRVRNFHGPATQYQCECGNQAEEWTYNHFDRLSPGLDPLLTV